MASVLRISEAASLALHTVTCLSSSSGKPIAAKDVAERLGVSEAHLSKVLQRLSKAGIVRSTRGPHGGFRLARNANDVTLLDVFEAIEGPMGRETCLLKRRVCLDGCMLGNLMEDVTEQVRGRLAGTRLADLSDRFGGDDDVDARSEDGSHR